MKLITRGLVGLVGALSILTALGLWFNMEASVARMGIEPIGLVGRATVRADIAGLFVGIGVMMLMAAWKSSRSWAFGALVLTSGALAGRILSLLIDGSSAESWPPIVVEAVAVSLLLWARSAWKSAA